MTDSVAPEQSGLPANASPKGALKGLLLSLVINVGIPLLIMYLLMTYGHVSQVVALSIASLVPVLNSIVDFTRHRSLDLIAIFFLLGSLTNILAIVFGGPVQLLIIRESFFSGALGLICLLSLIFFPRPLMFYVGRQMLAGTDPARIKRFNDSWQNPSVRASHRLITSVWGGALLGEFVFRVVIALTLPTLLAYSLGGTIFTITLTVTFLWTFVYIARVRRREASSQAGQA
ncbi:hypothetical protein KDA_56530 [Dictyobacter alpinus]|uniref:DUF3159 domain-containing protein n=1 Tax=Dictyobacter alpinus TaxID=2014873 RepID=A0A402BFS4_9CHLR|nr:VC0807 family protein [Dictyobacter alpinus]GCE30169.1 hypothetical protein KDA_56530 [Dictyobacter alpinus]